MRFTRQIISFKSIFLFILIACSSPTARAKSVYAIIDHPSDIIGAYKIDVNQIEYQTEIQAPQHGYRAIDLAIDSDSSCIFVTYEGSNIIEIMNAKTLDNEGSVTATGATNLAGIVFDEAKQKLYTVYRGTNNLFVYFWNPNTKTLTPDGINPKFLADLTDAHGIALDTTNNHLYVANRTNIVHYYDTNDWRHLDSNDIGEIAVDVDIDSDRGYLYAGGYTAHNYLLKLDLSTGIAEANYIGAGVIGLAVDPNSGLVYTTTFHNQLRVYDTSTSPFTLTDYEDIIKGCGVCVPTADVSYKPPVFYLEKVDVNEPNCVLPGDYITYTITYGPNGFDHNDVVITDYLPYEVDFSSADSNGIYDPNLHRVTWVIEPLDANDPDDSVMLTVEVNQLAEPLGTIHNYCEIESDLYCTTASEDTNVCFWSPDIIYVDVNAVGSDSGLSWYHADPNLQRALQKAQAWNSNQIWVAAGTYKPTTEPGDYYTAFELVNGVDIYGGFAGNESAITQRNLMINETILDGNLPEYGVSYVVGANDVNETTIIDGFTITNGWWAGIYSVNSSLIIGHNRISDNGYGIYCINWSSVNVTNCDIINNRSRENVDGGGIYCDDSNNLTIADCMIIDNISDANGGGIYCEDSNNVTITNCIFSGNSAGYGGGIFNNSSDPNITNCIFTGNTAGYAYGGGMYNYNESMPTIVNCIFTGNASTSWDGGGMYNHQSSPTLINCTFSKNSAGRYGGGICNWNYSDPNLTNCIFWDNEAGTDGNEIYDDNSCNPNVTFCDVNGGWAGTGNIDEDPCFFSVEQSTGSWTDDASYDSSTFQSTLTDANASWSVNELAGRFIDPNTSQYLQFLIVSNDTNTINVWGDVTSIADVNNTYEIFDYHLSSKSPCIDAGDPNFDPDPNETDIDGEPRVIDGNGDGNSVVDMGADEYDYRDADFNNDGIVNFIDYAMFANTWQTGSNDPNYNDICDLADNNSIDYADLAIFCEDWLWIAGWAQTEGAMMGQGMSQGFRLMEGLYLSAPAKQQPTKIKPLDIEYIIKWLEEIWLDEEVRKVITEDEWLKFMESLKEGW